jgi:hypothetical protein
LTSLLKLKSIHISRTAVSTNTRHKTETLEFFCIPRREGGTDTAENLQRTLKEEEDRLVARIKAVFDAQSDGDAQYFFSDALALGRIRGA